MAFDIGQIIYEALKSLGVFGLLLCIFLLFYIDAILFPTLPELFAVIIFMANPTPGFAAMIVMTIVFAEVLGLTTMYLIIKAIGLPRRISAVLERYSNLLIVRDERVILLNRIAPVLPFVGAFAATCHWSFKKCIFYTVIGGVIKYGAILALSTVFYAYMSSGEATLVTTILILFIVGTSIVLSLRRKKRLEARAKEDTSPPKPEC
jgi:membrane protein YqaA with SNARE-associated domain